MCLTIHCRVNVFHQNTTPKQTKYIVEHFFFKLINEDDILNSENFLQIFINKNTRIFNSFNLKILAQEYSCHCQLEVYVSPL